MASPLPQNNSMDSKRSHSVDYSFPLNDDDSWLCFLRTNGYVVVKEVLSSQDVETVKDLIWQDIEGAYSSLSRQDPSTWSKWMLPVHGIVASLAQTAGPWYVRGHANVKRAFQKIWETPNLITSMDAVLLWRSDVFHDTEGLHLDQNPFMKPQLDCIQGMIPLLPVTQEIGGLEVVPFSHTSQAKEKFCEAYPEHEYTGDFVMVDETSIHCRGVTLLECEPGDLILWDSRTIHGGTVGPEGACVQDTEMLPHVTRMSITVAMTPRDWAKSEVQEVRRNCFQRGNAMNHCPHEGGTSSGTIQAGRKKGYKSFQLTESQQAVL